MRIFVLGAALVTLPACVVLRVGLGATTARVEAPERPGPFDSEVGLATGVAEGLPLLVSVLAVNRHASSAGGRPLTGLEAGWLDLRGMAAAPATAAAPSAAATSPAPAPPAAEAAQAPGPQRPASPGGGSSFLPFLGGRIEFGHDDHDRYLGGAIVARGILWSERLNPWIPSAEVIFSFGTYLGRDPGLVVGLHVLVGQF